MPFPNLARMKSEQVPATASVHAPGGEVAYTLNAKHGFYIRDKRLVYTDCTGEEAPIQLEFVRLDDYPLLVSPSKALSPHVHVIKNDIAELIQSSTGLFVIASQFNSVEYRNSQTPVRHVQEYMRDRTAGPSAQMAADPGLAQCLLDMAWNGKLNSIPFVDDFQGIFELRNGYLFAYPPDDPEVQQSVIERFEQELSKTRVTVSSNVPACGYANGRMHSGDHPHRVHLAYCSAMPYNYREMSYGSNGSQPMNTGAFCERVCKLILRAQYASAFRYAIDNNVDQIYLTLLGGGVFNNKLEWIVDAIRDVIENAKRYHVQRSTETIFPLVYVNTYKDDEFRFMQSAFGSLP